ncbi:hypothetical protein VTN02DRAFT_6668 [Thermoascus thermophilus]
MPAGAAGQALSSPPVDGSDPEPQAVYPSERIAVEEPGAGDGEGGISQSSHSIGQHAVIEHRIPWSLDQPSGEPGDGTADRQSARGISGLLQPGVFNPFFVIWMIMAQAHLESSKLFSVEGLVAVITGGGSGLGRTMALALDANKASKVFIIGRREQALKETAAAATNGTVIPVVGDVASKESLQAAYDEVASRTDHIDLLIANSGIISPMDPRTPDGSTPTLRELRDLLWSVPMEDFTRASHVNVTGAYYTVLAFLPLLEAANEKRMAPVPGELSPPRPQVILTSSVAGFSRLASFGTAYSLSKAAVNHLVKMLASRLAPYDIRVNGIAPGLYHTDMAAPMFAAHGVVGRGVTDGSLPRTMVPLTRGGSDQDLAGMILWMAGAAGGYLNGNIVVSDGGRLGSIPATY